MVSREEVKKWIRTIEGFATNDDSKKEEIERMISTTDESKIIQCLDYLISHDEKQLVPISSLISSGLSEDTPANRMKRKKVVRTLIDALRESKVDPNTAATVLCHLISEIEHLKPQDILDFLREYRRHFESGMENVGERYVEVFGRLLNFLDRDRAQVDGKPSGAQMRVTFLAEFLQFRRVDDDEARDEGSKWHPSMVSHILFGLKDGLIHSEERNRAAAKAIHLLGEVKMDGFHGLASVVNEMLSLTNWDDRTLVLTGICEYFTGKDKERYAREEPVDAEAWTMINRCEGNVMNHLMRAAQNHRETGRILLNVLKAQDKDLLMPFNFGLLLAISRVNPRFKEEGLDVAKTAVLNCLKIREAREKSPWVRTNLLFEIDFDKLIKEITEISEPGLGWDSSVLGLRDLAFSLLEVHLPKLTIMANGKLSSEAPNSLGYGACNLGKTIIFKAFTMANQEDRQNIIKKVFDLITIPKSDNVRNAGLFYISIMSGFVTRGGSAFLATDEFIPNMLELMPRISSEVAVPLMKAWIPLIQKRPAIREAFVLTLKNAIFSRGIDAKKTAVGGFLLFLKHFKIANNFKSGQSQSSYCHSFPTYGSQAMPEPGKDPQRVHYERLCFEVIGCLRRTLSEHAELKELLYYGFCSVVRRNISTLTPVLDFLDRNLAKYLVDPDSDSKEPFKLDMCVQVISGAAVTTEAIGWLIYALTRIVKQGDDDRKKVLADEENGGSLSQRLYFNNSTLTKIQGVLDKLTERISNLDLEDVGLDKLADYSPTAEGEKNVKRGTLMLSAFEATIGHFMTFFDFSETTAERILSVFKKHQELQVELKKSTTNKTKKAAVTAGGAAAAVARPKPFAQSANSSSIDTTPIELSSLLEFASHLLRDQSPHRREGLEPLRDDDEFVHWLFNTILTKVKNLSSRRKADSARAFDTICKISALMHQYYADGDTIVGDMKRAKLKKLKLVALEIMVAVLDVVSLQFVEKLSDALQIWSNALGSNSQSSPDDERDYATLGTYGHTFQNHLKNLLIKRAESTPQRRRGANNTNDDDAQDDPTDELSPRHLVTLIKIIDVVTKNLPSKSHQARAIYRFMSELCDTQEIKDSMVAKALWQSILRMHRRLVTDGNLMAELSKDLRHEIGPVPTDGPEIEREKAHASLNSKTAAGVMGVLLLELDGWQEECSFLVDHVKRKLVLAKSRKGVGWERNIDMDDSICDHLHELGNVWMIVAQTTIPQVHNHQAIKSLKGYFCACNSFIRYVIMLHQSKMGTLTDKFVTFGNFVGSTLIKYVSKFISFLKCTVDPAAGVPETKAKKISSAKQAKRDSKEIADLGFAMDTYEKYLIELSSKCKDKKVGKKLVNHLYLGNNRDFKIDFEKLTAVHNAARNGGEDAGGNNEEDADEVEVDDEPMDADFENDTAAAKKRKATAVSKGQKMQKRKKISDEF